MEKTGIKNLKIAIIALGGMGQVGELVKSGEYMKAIYEAGDEVKALFAIDYAELKKELAEVDSLEAAELKQDFKAAFKLSDEKLETALELAIDGLQETVSGVLKIKEAITTYRA